MGWRFKKPLNFGGFRLNLSRRGLGFSWGFPMFRTGISADGRRYLWITIPRTGLSWIKYFGKKPKTSVQPQLPPFSPPTSTSPSGAPNPAGSAPGSSTAKQAPWWTQKNFP